MQHKNAIESESLVGQSVNRQDRIVGSTKIGLIDKVGGGRGSEIVLTSSKTASSTSASSPLRPGSGQHRTHSEASAMQSAQSITGPSRALTSARTPLARTAAKNKLQSAFEHDGE